MKTKAKNQRILQARSAEALGRLTGEFDREMVAEEFAPLSAPNRRRWAQAQRKRGRPPKGRGAQVVSVSIEKELLARSDALAHRIGVTRSALIERGLKAVLAVRGGD